MNCLIVGGRTQIVVADGPLAEKLWLHRMVQQEQQLGQIHPAELAALPPDVRIDLKITVSLPVGKHRGNDADIFCGLIR